MSERELRADELERAVACVRAHAHAAALAAFAYDVLGSQAEGRALFAGQKFMAQRAEAHAVDDGQAATDLGNLKAILERGPSEPMEHALVSAFTAHGLASALVAAQGDARKALLEKWVPALDWLETTTRFRVWPCFLQLAAADEVSAFCEAIADAVLRDAAVSGKARGDAPQLAARTAARVAMLAAVSGASARVALQRIREQAVEPAASALASIALGESIAPAKAQAVRVYGPCVSGTGSSFVALARVLSGYALLHAALRALGFLVRLRRELELELEGRVLRERRRTWLLGRIVRSREALYPVERVRGAARSGRYALVRTLAGVIALSLGVLVGGHFLFDAARGGATALLSLGALACGLGALLDLGLDVLSPARQRHVRLQVDLDRGRALSLGRVPSAEADAFLDALDARLAQRSQ